jgi:hypothetical protein
MKLRRLASDVWSAAFTPLRHSTSQGHGTSKRRKHRAPFIAAAVVAMTIHLSAAEISAGRIQKGTFDVSYDERGITGLANPSDPFKAQMLAREQRLGLSVRYRLSDGDWQDIATNKVQLAAAPMMPGWFTSAQRRTARSRFGKRSP